MFGRGFMVLLCFSDRTTHRGQMLEKETEREREKDLELKKLQIIVSKVLNK